ncbi:MAG: radical SAM family heme chaperone HemW [Actinobacteria bacterium]|nr:radical SAM family heme chaperone HemW [Actinomycetota bacterium]
MAAPSDAGVGIYLHVPFCLRRCHYCDFNTYADREALIPAYVAALRADIDAVAAAGPRAVGPPGSDGRGDWPTFDSVFVGGGTPTLLPAADLAGILRLVAQRFQLAGDAEVTVEANPETVDVEQMRVLADAGVTRVSIGAQSFVPRVLDALGRWHAPDAPLRAVEACRDAGVDQLSLDLIYGTPAESDADWRHSVRTALQTGVDHLSAYALTVEAGTEYGRRVRLGTATAPDDDVQAQRMEQVDAWAAAAGLARYELSNWARPRAESVHNGIYWRGGDWLGIGAGAHGHWRGRRWWCMRSLELYVRAALAGESTVAGAEVPDAAQRRAERLLMGLRLRHGVDRQQVAPVDDVVVRRLADAGLLTATDDRLALTSSGMRLASAVTLELL